MTAEVTHLKLAEMFTLQVVTVLLVLCQLARPATTARDEGFVLASAMIEELVLASGMDEERGTQALSELSSVAKLDAALLRRVLQGAPHASRSIASISNNARLLGVELPCMGERAVELVPVSELNRVWTMALVGAPADELHGGCTP